MIVAYMWTSLVSVKRWIPIPGVYSIFRTDSHFLRTNLTILFRSVNGAPEVLRVRLGLGAKIRTKLTEETMVSLIFPETIMDEKHSGFINERTVGFTGSRIGMSDFQLLQLRILLSSAESIREVHHGGAKGGDAEFHFLVRRLRPDLKIIIHPATDGGQDVLIDAAGSIYLNPKRSQLRNRDIVQSSEVLIAAPASDIEPIRSGTWATVRYARKTGKCAIILSREPNNRDNTVN